VTPTDPRIRAATDDDWPRIWPFFSAIVAEGETYAFPDDLTIETGRGWWLAQPPSRTVVLEDDGRILGSASMGRNRPGRGDHVGTASFMVEPAAAGRGIGRALASYVVEWHRAQGFSAIQFNAVVETNLAAVHLWQTFGFEIIGTVPRAFRSATHGEVGLHVMHLDLR
jgi:L-amino acid N-acyltransferase YncA